MINSKTRFGKMLLVKSLGPAILTSNFFLMISYHFISISQAFDGWFLFRLRSRDEQQQQQSA
jgi:hypothetical protein